MAFPSQEINIRFLAEGLALFRAMREEGVRTLDSLWSRLGCELPPPRENVGSPGAPPAAIGPDTNGFGAALRRICREVVLWRASGRQARRMTAARSGLQPGPDLVLAINSIRLFDACAAKEPRRYLAQLLRGLPGTKSGGAAPCDQVASARLIYIFDPNFESKYRGSEEALNQAGIFVIDAALLLRLSQRSVPATVFSYVRSFGEFRRFAIKDGFLLILFAKTYERLLSRQTPLKAFFLTSNSFVTEALRLSLMRHRSCEILCEVMHGVPTKEVTRYFASLGALSARHHCPVRQTFIPQIPRLPLDPVYRSPEGSEHFLAINTYVNRHFLSHPAARPPRQMLEEGWHRLQPRLASSRPLIILFIGANSHDQDFAASAAFRIEQNLIRLVKRRLEASGVAYLVVYSPHPRHDASQLSRAPFFAEDGLAVHPGTIFGWLVADCSVSLFSSALFEAQYLGSRVFCPLLPQDDLFDPRLLDALDHPTSPSLENLVTSVNRFLDKCMHDGKVDLLGRAEDRLRLLIPSP